MAKPNFPEKQTTWGTLEELLLACAVHRYGTDSWDSVTAELRKRSSSLHLFTPHSCKHKYNDLKRRFTQNDVVSATATANDGGIAAAVTIPFLDELRRLRVAELRREVERYDLSIVSLESKVEKLKEEREQSLNGAEKADLKKNLERESKDEEIKPEDESPEAMAEKAVSGEGTVPDERSFDESNSTNLKGEAPETGGGATDKESAPSEPDVGVGGEPDRVREYGKPVVEDSYNGSSETIAKESAAVSPVQESEKVNSEKNGGDGDGDGDSAESKGGEEGTKEVCSSEMQSSTSLSRKKVEEEPDEPEGEDQSIETKRAPVESQALINFLEILRSHKSGSFFERRLEIQETPNYMNTIRQHMDFEMVRNRLEEGWYSGCKTKFFRDLMLIFNNAIVFFGRKSSESKAAIELRLLLLKEMAPKPTTKKDSSAKEKSRALPSKREEEEEEEEPSKMLLRKPKLSVPMTACRKRSSITARASTSSSGPERKREPTTALLDVKSAMSWKQSDKSGGSDKGEEFSGTKKKRKDRFRIGTRNSSNKSGASRSSAEINKNSGSNTNTNNVGTSTRGGASNENSNSVSKAADKEKNNSSSTTSGKKRSATNFLNRMKRSSSSNNGSLLETLKDSDTSSRGEQKRNGGGKGSSSSSSKQKEQASRRASGSKQEKEPDSPAKRSVGRPSKRAAAAVVPAKRSRQAVETEAVAPKNAKKRSRK